MTSHPLLRFLLLGLFAATLAAGAAAQTQGIAIELNRAQSEPGGGCQGAFVIQNHTGQTLDRFNIDICVFNAEGKILDRLIVDLAPLHGGRTRIASFGLSPQPCAAISKLVVHDIPECRSQETQSQLDCIHDLSVSSRSVIGLSK